MSEIEKKLSLLPESAGVYVMQNKDGEIIYVGKAKNLKNRVDKPGLYNYNLDYGKHKNTRKQLIFKKHC